MRVAIFSCYEGKWAKIQDHRAEMAKISSAKKESNIEEAKVNAKEFKDEVITREDVFILPNELVFK